MKEKIIEYIEDLESKANDSNKFFMERNKALEEIERLNNIITELEKWLEKERELDFNNKQCIEAILDKLKELKENTNGKD